MARMTKAEKAVETRVESLCNRAVIGSVVSIWDLSKISKVAREAVLAGGEDADQLAKVQAFVQTVKVG